MNDPDYVYEPVLEVWKKIAKAVNSGKTYQEIRTLIKDEGFCMMPIEQHEMLKQRIIELRDE
jgi:hypothetical protein